MASILRSGKLLRYFAGLTRSVVFQSLHQTEGNFVQNSQCICSGLTNGYATIAPKADLSLEKQLKRLDQDVRRTGRISRRDIEEVLEEIRHQRSATSSQSLLVIRCCGNLVPEELPEVRTALVQEIWNTLNSLNVPMDISHYNALLRVYLENEHPFSPTEFLSELESKAIDPNRVTYQRLILRYCQQGDIDGATRILEYMREKNLPVNENVFNALILGHSQANDIESAKSILTVMKQTGLEPSADTYTTLLCCYARHGDVDSILRTIEECEKNEIFLLDKDLLDAVYGLAVNGHEAKVDRVIEKLRKFTGFNQEAVNVILRLVNKGYEDVGLKILRVMPRSTRPDGQLVDVGIFFVRQLVKVNRPIEKILSICKQLQDEGLNPKALLIATEAGLSCGPNNTALPLLKELKNAGQPIRQHYFWPLLCSAENNEVIDILQKMQNEFNVTPNSETVRDYVIPRLKEKNLDLVVTILTNAGISNGTAASAAAYNAVTQNKLSEAAKIVENYRAFYAPVLYRQPLIQALGKTEDYKSFIRIVRQIHDNLGKDNIKEVQSEEPVAEEGETAEQKQVETSSNNRAEFIGQIANDAASYFRNNRSEVLQNILTQLVEQGLSMSNAAASKIQERLGSEMTPQISELLSKLTSGELEPIQLNTPSTRKRTLDKLNIDELERFITHQEAKGENTNNIKRQLISTCFKSRNLDKTVQVIQRLESEKFQISTGVWAQLIDLYTQFNRLDEAMLLYAKIKDKEPEFLLDNLKAVRVAELLVKSDQTDVAIAFLEKNKKDSLQEDGEGSFNYISTCWRVLNLLAEAGNAEKLQAMFDALVNNNYVLPTNVLLGPLIKVHLVRDDVQKAIETFEEITQTYKATPWKNELACRLIQKEDATNLQKLTDLSTSIHGEVNSLYDLVLSFVECGRIRQARKILETPGLRTRPKRIDFACERYRNEGMVEPLEGLIEATKDLHHIDRNSIYYNLLLSYCKNDDADKSLGLWTKMQEDSITPTDAFLSKLSQFLKSKNVPVPFVVPPKPKRVTVDKEVATLEVVQLGEPKVEKTSPAPPPPPPAPTGLIQFRTALKARDVDNAIFLKQKLTTGEQPSMMDMSQIIELLIHAQRLNEATNYVFELLEKGRRPIPKVFKFYLNKIASSGDTETMERIGQFLTSEQKKVVSFDNRYCHANIVAGKCEQYLKVLSDLVANAETDEEVTAAVDKFPRGGSLGILENHSELLPQLENIARIFAAKNQMRPMNILWIYHLMKGNEKSALDIWKQHLGNEPRVLFRKILKNSRKCRNEELVEKLITQLVNGLKISAASIGRAYSCLLDIQCQKGNYDKALKTLKQALKTVSLDNIDPRTLSILKAGVKSKVEKLAVAFANKKQVAPMNVLWIYHSISGNEAAAKNIWEKYLINEPRLMFQRILQNARDKNDEKLVQNLVDQLVTSKISQGAIGNAYSCLLDIQCANKNFDKGLETLNKALKVGSIETINRTALLRLKEGIEASGKKFAHKIPDKKGVKADDSSSSSSSSSCTSSDSSSDSDDEKQKGK